MLIDHTFSRFSFNLPAEQRRDADNSRQDPDGRYHGRHARRRPLHGVLERALDDEIPVDTDGAQVQYGRSAEQNVK